MNERIKELLKEATEVHDDRKTGMTYTTVDYKLFAELIVRECSYLSDQAHHKATGGKSAGGYIRQQLGVE